MTDSKGFRRGFLLGTTKKTKKKVSHTVLKVSSALLDLENPRHSIFAVAPGSSDNELGQSPKKEGSPLFTAVKTNRKPQATLCDNPDVLGKGHGPEDTINLFLTPSVPKEDSKWHSSEAKPRWLLTDESSQPKSQVTNESIRAPLEKGNDEIVNEFASTLIRMKRSTDWRKIGSNFLQSHIPKRNYVWDLILEGDLTLAKSRLALCVLQQHGSDTLIASLRESGSKAARYRTMRCLAIIEDRLDQDGASSDLVEASLPEIGRIAMSEDERTSLAQQAVEIGIKLISAASLVGSSDPDMANLLHSKISTVDQLLDTQMAWLGNENNWFTVSGARYWCKHSVIVYWRNLNAIHRDSGAATRWCRELQGLDKQQHMHTASFASTLLPSSKFPIDGFIDILRLSLENKDPQYEAGLADFLAWLGRKGTRIQSELRDKFDCAEKLLLDLLTQRTYLVPPIAALNALWSYDGFVPRDVLHMTLPYKRLPSSLERIAALVSWTKADPEYKLIRDFALNTLFNSSILVGPSLLELLVDLEVDSGFVQELSCRTAIG